MSLLEPRRRRRISVPSFRLRNPDAIRITPGARRRKMGTPITLFSGRKRLVWFIVVLFVVLFGPGSSRPTEAACGGSPVIATNKPDYSPTEIVVISGTGFNCQESLSVLVTAPDGSTRSGDGTGAAGPDSVVIDDNGCVRAQLSTYLARWPTAALIRDSSGSTGWRYAMAPA